LGGRLTRIFQQYQWPILASLGPAGWVIVSVAAGISEELFFRGFIQEAVIQRTNLVIGILLASGIFGLFHWIHWSIVIFTGLLGLYFGLLYYFSDNIVVPIVAHTIHNVVSLFLAARLFGYPLRESPTVEFRPAEAVSSGGDDSIPPVEEKGSDSS
jgi:membrane protease YdiL (CAAX protease family)